MKRDAIANIQESMSLLTDAQVEGLVRDLEKAVCITQQQGALLQACRGLLQKRKEEHESGSGTKESK